MMSAIFKASISARLEDGQHSSSGGIDDRARNPRQAAAGPEAEGVHATRAHPCGAGQGDHGGQGSRRLNPRRRSSSASAIVVLFPSAGRRSAIPLLHRGQDHGPLESASRAPFMSTAIRLRSDSPFAFPSNFELSQARAKSVAVMLDQGLAHPERLAVTGRVPAIRSLQTTQSLTNREIGASKSPSREPIRGEASLRSRRRPR